MHCNSYYIDYSEVQLYAYDVKVKMEKVKIIMTDGE